MPQRIPPLTAKRLDAIRPGDGELIELGDGLLPGLRVRITKGGRFWSLNIRNPRGEREVISYVEPPALASRVANIEGPEATALGNANA